MVRPTLNFENLNCLLKCHTCRCALEGDSAKQNLRVQSTVLLLAAGMKRAHTFQACSFHYLHCFPKRGFAFANWVTRELNGKIILGKLVTESVCYTYALEFSGLNSQIHPRAAIMTWHWKEFCFLGTSDFLYIPSESSFRFP